MILNFPAKIVPAANFLTDVGRVAVVEAAISSEEGSGVAQSWQYFKSEGLSE
jgi:hypothetical protein